jgi:hypothetical protein
MKFDPFEQTALVEMEIVHTSGDELLASERHRVNLGLYFKNEIELMLRHMGFSDIEVTAFGEDRPPDPWNDVRIAIQARRH